MNLTRLGVLLSVVVACLSQVKAFVLTRPDRKVLEKKIEVSQEELVYLQKILEALEPLTEDVASYPSQTVSEDQNLDQGYHLSEETREKLMFLEKIWAEVEAPKENYQAESDVVDRTSYKGPDSTNIRIQPLKDDRSFDPVINLEKKDYAILPPATEWCRIMGFRQCGKNRSRR